MVNPQNAGFRTCLNAFPSQRDAGTTGVKKVINPEILFKPMERLSLLMALSLLVATALLPSAVAGIEISGTTSASCQSSGSCSCTPGDLCSVAPDCYTDTCGYTCPSVSHASLSSNTCSADHGSGCHCIGHSCMGSCSCTISGTCYYTCASGYADCDGSAGCECHSPSNCCGGSGSNSRYYSCSICDGSTCASCDATSCVEQACGTTSYCSSGSCLSCASGTKNCDQNAANGCECSAPSNCCVGNLRYYSCTTICSGGSCATCGSGAGCSLEDCGSGSYCSSGSCAACSSNQQNCDQWAPNGCECSRPSDCCGGSGGNTRYYSCGICSGLSCASCGASYCSSQDCGNSNYCSSGSCLSCSAGTANCDQAAANGCETNLNTNLNNCGACSNACPDTYSVCGEPTCAGGNCDNTAYSAGQITGCTSATGCSSNGVGQQVCACNGAGACSDSCGDSICQSWESYDACSYDCGGGDPTIASATDYPDPASAGTDVNFSVSWTNPNATEQIKMHLCKNGTITGQTCAAGSWCDSSDFTLTTPTSCNYTTQANDNGTKSYYAFVCDEGNNCSASTLGTFTVNVAPSITSITDFPDPLNASTQAEFDVAWSDPNATELAKAHICKSDSLSGVSCTAGSWCDSAAFTLASPASCNYTTVDGGVKDYYAFVCDDEGLCSASSSGTFTVNAAPSITSATASPSPVDADAQIQFSAVWSDVNVGEQVKIHVCKTNAFSSACTGGSWCDSSGFTLTSPAACNYTAQIADSGAQSYYAFVCDDGSLCSSSRAGTFAVMVTTQNKLWAKLTINGTSGSVYLPGTGLASADALGNVLPYYPAQKFIASYVGNVLYGFARAAGTTVSISASNTSANHTVAMSADISGSKLLLAFTKGDWRTISERIALLDAMTFLTYPSPSFAYGLGKTSLATIMMAYSSLDIGNDAVYQRGGYRLTAHNTGESGGKASINVTR